MMEVEFATEVSPDSLGDEFIRFKQNSNSSLSTDTAHSLIVEDISDSGADAEHNGIDCSQIDDCEDPCGVYEDLQFLTKVLFTCLSHLFCRFPINSSLELYIF